MGGRHHRASNGSVNSMHDSYQPLGGIAPMFNMAIGEVIFGGVGSGLYGMIFYVVVAVFIGGLMVGRTPEYLGQEDPRPGGEDRRRRGPGPVPGRASRSRRWRWSLPAGLAGRLNTRAARIQRDPLRLPVAGATTTVRPSPGSPRTRPSTRSPAGSRCCVSRFVPLIAALALGASVGTRTDRPVHRRHPAHRHAPCSSAC